MMTDKKAYEADFQYTRPMSVAELKARGLWDRLDESSKRVRKYMDKKMSLRDRIKAREALDKYKKLKEMVNQE